MALMKIFIKLEVLDAANCSENKLAKLDVSNIANQIPSDTIRLPTATKALLKSTAGDVNKKHRFKKECVAMLVAIMQKLQEKSPLKHLPVCCASCLDMHRMSCNKEECSLRFSGIVDKLYKNKWITSNDADLAKKEFDTFLETVQHEYKDDLLMYDVKSKRIDHFIGSCLHGNDKYGNCWKIIVCICFVPWPKCGRKGF